MAVTTKVSCWKRSTSDCGQKRTLGAKTLTDGSHVVCSATLLRASVRVLKKTSHKELEVRNSVLKGTRKMDWILFGAIVVRNSSLILEAGLPVKEGVELTLLIRVYALIGVFIGF